MNFVIVPDGALAITALQELQVRRRHYIRLQVKISNTLLALVRRAMGFRGDLPEAEREKIRNRATRLLGRFMAGKPWLDDEDIGIALATDLGAGKVMLDEVARQRKVMEGTMIAIARKLHVRDFAASVAGFGELALAVIIGEAGDLANYATPDKLRKRLGLAPYKGKSYSNWRRGGLTDDEWKAAGYNPQRRAEIWAVVEDPLFRHQSFRNGPYKAVYDARRARTAETHPDWTKGHSHHDAKRVMVQRLIDDLWAAWRRE